jgi:hypothetical protein
MPSDATHKTTIVTTNFDVHTVPLNGGTSFLFIGTGGSGPHPTDGINALVAGSLTQDGFIVVFDVALPVVSVGFDLIDTGEHLGILSFHNNIGDVVEMVNSPPILPQGSVIFWGIDSDTPFTGFALQKTQLQDGIALDRMYIEYALSGDINLDGQIDGLDLNILGNNWHVGVPAPGSQIPEPGTLALLGAGGLAVARRSKRTRNQEPVTTRKPAIYTDLPIYDLAIEPHPGADDLPRSSRRKKSLTQSRRVCRGRY